MPRSWLESCRTSSMRIRSVSSLLSALDHPLRAAVVGGALVEPARRAHPVQRLVRAVVGVHRHRAVGLDQHQPGGHRQVGAQPAGVVDLAAGDQQAHEGERSQSPQCQTHPVVHSETQLAGLPAAVAAARGAGRRAVLDAGAADRRQRAGRAAATAAGAARHPGRALPGRTGPAPGRRAVGAGRAVRRAGVRRRRGRRSCSTSSPRRCSATSRSGRGWVLTTYAGSPTCAAPP